MPYSFAVAYVFPVLRVHGLVTNLAERAQVLRNVFSAIAPLYWIVVSLPALAFADWIDACSAPSAGHVDPHGIALAVRLEADAARAHRVP